MKYRFSKKIRLRVRKKHSNLVIRLAVMIGKGFLLAGIALLVFFNNLFHTAAMQLRLLGKKIRLLVKEKYSSLGIRLAVIIGTGVLLVGIVLLVFSNDLFHTAAMESQVTMAPPSQSATPTTTSSQPQNTPPPQPTPEPQLKQGDDSEVVKTLQERLMSLGYLDIDEPTMHFGPATEFALELFQRQHNIQIDGILGDSTRKVLFSDDARPYTMYEGAKGNDIKAFQQRLKELGYLKNVTSYYGPQTVKAVKDFQKRNKLTVDGKAGEQTLGLIFSPKAKGPSVIKSSVGKNIDKFIAFAEEQLGKKYVSGNEGPDTFDCSGLVYYTLTQNGIKTGRYNAAGFSQEDKWKAVTSMKDLKRGDLLFFSTSRKKIGHTGIYIGKGMMIDASSSNGKVVKRPCFTSFWKSHFIIARRPWK